MEIANYRDHSAPILEALPLVLHQQLPGELVVRQCKRGVTCYSVRIAFCERCVCKC